MTSVRHWARRAAAIPAAAPATLTYLFTLLITQLTLSTVDDRLGERLLISESTNLVNMARVPVQVLIGSAFWIDAGPGWTVAALLAVMAVLGPLEAKLGTARWLAVTITGHVGATALTVLAALQLRRAGLVGPAVTHASDVGVSYAVMAGAGALLLGLPGAGRRLAALVAGLALLTPPLVFDHQVADLGHPLALMLGFALAGLLPAVFPPAEPLGRPLPASEPLALPRPAPPVDPTGPVPGSGPRALAVPEKG